MSFQLWTKKWLVAVTVCLIVSTTCSLILLVNTLMNGTSDPKYVVNQVRLAGNPIILYLERNGRNLDRANVREALLAPSINSILFKISIGWNSTLASAGFGLSL
ncbi:hypothetical protein [Paenibacillus daejeonensis]|uniref:hypothetical protein n=1 Tax=Paenibacillus daejeonensis TaxID=135193 RepID=UPI00036044D5|nr:hypothetical protein [Paenibacillus daejeonensis]